MSNELLGRRAAENFRREHELGNQPISDLAFEIEQKLGVDVVIFEAPVGGAGHGMTLTNGKTTLIGVACTPHPMRQRSTLAHELGHLCLQTVTNTRDASRVWEKSDSEETAANSFARHLLAPREDIKKRLAGIQDIEEEVLSDLVQAYEVSPQVIAIQLRELGFISSEECRTLSKLRTPQLAERYGWGGKYRGMAQMSNTPRPPQSLLARAMEGYQKGILSPSYIARLEGKKNLKEVQERLQDELVWDQELDGEELEEFVLGSTSIPASKPAPNEKLDMHYLREMFGES